MKILLVEDTRSLGVVMSARLGSLGHEVVLAENGRKAVDLFAAETPDLVLMDIEMPVMNGFEAVSRIRALETTREWAWTPVIFLTASDTIENLVTAIEAGGDDFMAKTAPEPVLHAKMKAMSRIAALRQRLAVANGKLTEMVNRDALTGLCNRHSMDVRTDAAWRDMQQASAAFALLMIDVDNFKNFNDHYGHMAGDDCLRAVSGALAATLAKAADQVPDAFAARYGGEEFAIVIPDVDSRTLRRFAEDIVVAVRALGIKHEKNAPWGVVTVSVGGARVDVASGELAYVFRAADARLYCAKDEGRNCAILEE